ncbi:MAG: hypothetical protein H6Q84_1394 [Deltaproteobacteria bacterium]|nr:hypothetical protein [Deltaproteobacteria bacterium]
MKRKGENGLGVRDRNLIEERFGPLWSGKNEIFRDGRARTLLEVKRSFDLSGDDVVAIDLIELPADGFAFRFYDGDDRCIVVFVVDARGEILEEHRAHIAEWLGDVYHETGALAFDPEALLHILRKQREEGPR